MKSLRIELQEISHRVLTWPSAGKGGPTWLFLHGWLDQGDSFVPMIEALRAEKGDMGSCVALDFRGHGHSGWIRGGGYYHFPDYVRDVHGLLATLPELQGEVLLVGHSMGGTVATYVAASMPEKFNRLVLMEGMGPFGAQPEDSPKRMRKWLHDLKKYRSPRYFKSQEVMLQALELHYPELDSTVLSDFCQRSTLHDEKGYRWRYDPLHRSVSPVPFTSATYYAFAAEVQCPVLAISGSKSLMVAHKMRELSRREAAFRSPLCNRTIEGAGHMMHLSHPSVVAREIRDWEDGYEGN